MILHLRCQRPINAVSVCQRAFYSSVFRVAHAPSIYHKANERESDVVFSPVLFVYADMHRLFCFECMGLPKGKFEQHSEVLDNNYCLQGE